ncbi:hypothetical protein TNCV_391661 [Trichonephila clavipes]|nr:hypothetical protein TNCV_391661 [Trichonephila clavipes]
MQAGDERYPRGLLALHAEYLQKSHGLQNTTNRIGTRLKRLYCTTPVPIFLIQSDRESHQFRHLSLCWIVERSRSNGRHTNCPSYFKCHHTVRANTGHAVNVPTY